MRRISLFLLVLFSLFLLLFTQVGADDAPKKQVESAQVNQDLYLTLHHALSQNPFEDSARQDLNLRLKLKEGRLLDEVFGTSLNFNRGNHFGQVTEQKTTGQTMSASLEMTLARDPWIEGGNLKLDLSLENDGEKVTGQYKGTFRGWPISGKVTGQVLPALQPASDFRPVQAGEHPRLLFRQHELESIRERIKTPWGQALMQRIRASGDPICLAFLWAVERNERAGAAAEAWLQNNYDQRGFSHGAATLQVQKALTFDMIHDRLSERDRKKIIEKFTYHVERYLLDPRTIDYANTHPASNYMANLRPGIGAMSLVSLYDKTNKPFRPPNIRIREITQVLEQAPAGVPVVNLRAQYPATMANRFLVAAPFTTGSRVPVDANSDAPLTFKVDDQPINQQSAKFHPLDENLLRSMESAVYTNPLSLPGVKENATVVLHCLLENQAKEGRVFELKLRGYQQVILGNTLVKDRDIVKFKPGYTPATFVFELGKLPPIGKPVLALPMFKSIPDPSARIALWEMDQAEWEKSVADPVIARQSRFVNELVRQYFRLCFGPGGYALEGAGYTSFSGKWPQLYAELYRNVHGHEIMRSDHYRNWATLQVMRDIYKPYDASLRPDRSIGSRTQAFSLSASTFNSGQYANTFANVPDEYKPAVLWGWHRVMNLPDETRLKDMSEEQIRNARLPGGLHAIRMLLDYPMDMKPVNPAKVLPKVWYDPQKGGIVFRNHWQDENDIVTQLWAKSASSGGWSHPDAVTFRIRGFGHAWADNGQNEPKAGNRQYENIIFLPEDATNEGGPALVSRLIRHPDGSGVATLDLDPMLAGRSGDLFTEDVKLMPENLVDLGLRGSRSFLVDYSGKSGVEALVAIADHVQGGGPKHWLWQMPGDHRSRPELKIDKQSFTLNYPDSSCRVQFIQPQEVNIEHIQQPLHIHLKYGRFGNVPWNAIHVTDKSNDHSDTTFVAVITLSRKGHPDITSKMTGQTKSFQVGEQTLRFDGRDLHLPENEKAEVLVDRGDVELAYGSKRLQDHKQASNPGQIRITAQVLDEEGLLTPAPNCTITLYDRTGRLLKEAKADEQGIAVIESVKPGQYRLAARTSGEASAGFFGEVQVNSEKTSELQAILIPEND